MKKKKQNTPEVPPKPTLASRRMNRNSSFKMGRTIGERREKLESSSERMAARKKSEKKRTVRVSITSAVFFLAAIVLIYVGIVLVSGRKVDPSAPDNIDTTSYEPTVEIVDADASAAGISITNRMREYIGMIEVDFRDLGYKVVKAVIPSGSIREVDFYIEGKNGFIKTTIDRGTAVTVEDTDRVIRYLAERGIGDFEYIDARVEGRAFWK